MKRLFYFAIVLICLTYACQPKEANRSVQKPKPVTEVYFDTTLTDPFRHMENESDPEVQAWFKKQGAYTDSVLRNIRGREALLSLMQDFEQRRKYQVSQVHVTQNGQYFYLKRISGEDGARLCYRESLMAKEEILYPLANQDSAMPRIFAISPDWAGEQIAIALETNGSDVMDIVVYNRINRKINPDTIKNSFNATHKFAYWTPDNSGFLYLRKSSRDSSLTHMETWYYKAGDKGWASKPVFGKSPCSELDIKPEDFPIVSLNGQNDNYLLGYLAGPSLYNTVYRLPVKQIHSKTPKWELFYTKEQKISKGIIVGDEYLYISANEASNRMICSIKLNVLNFERSTVIVEEKANEVIQDIQVCSSGLYYTTTENGVRARLYRYKAGKEEEVELPGTYGRIQMESLSPDRPELWVTVSGWLTESTRMRYDAANGSLKVENLAPASSYPELDNYQIEELNVPSHDGELIPLSIISRKGVDRDGSNPTLLYGYGAYGISWRPSFMPDWLSWVENGGVLCFSHIRGGGEKGDHWHEMGRHEHKPNSWKDYIACAEYLIQSGYTKPKHLLSYGGSAGGIVIGRAMCERPDLFGTIVCEVGMLNAIRFAQMPSGLNHAKEFGYVDQKEDFENLLQMDAYMHLKEGVSYPPFMGIVGMNDTRVSPWQTGKFIARLQNLSSVENEVLMMVDFNEGHYFNSTKSKSMEKLASLFAFTLWQSGHPAYQITNP